MPNKLKPTEYADMTERMLDSMFAVCPKNRRQIASESGLSLMTVGKTLDLLTSAEVLLTDKSPTDSPGRKPSATYPNPEYYYIIIDKNEITVYDTTSSERTRIRIPENFKYNAEDEQSTADYINNLLMEFASRFNYFKCIGAGLIIEENECSKTDIESEEAKFSMSPFAVRIMTKYGAIQTALEKNGNLNEPLTYYLRSGEENFGLLFIDGKYRMGRISALGDISSVRNIEDITSDELCEFQKLLQFEKIIIEAGSDSKAHELESRLANTNHMLTIVKISETASTEHIGMISELRRGYLTKLTRRY